jgi:nucleolar GTP-binding protein
MNPLFKENESTKLESVGAFQKLPMVMPSVDILYSALRKAKRVPPTKGDSLGSSLLMS